MMGSSLSKLALSAGSTARELCEGRIRLADGGGYEPILVYESTYICRHRDLYSFVIGPILVAPLTYIGRYYLPAVGAVAHTAKVVRTGVKLRSSEQLCKTR